VKHSTLARFAIPAALGATLGLGACSASNETASSASPSAASAVSGDASSSPAASDTAASTGDTSSAAPSADASSAMSSSSMTSSSTSANGAGGPLSGTLKGSGSTAQTAAMAAWVAGFQQKNSGVTVNYNPIGSGGGVTAFLAGSASYAGSDAYLTTQELASSQKVCGAGGALDIPAYVSPIAVVYNLPSVTALKLDAPTIAKIFLGTIKKWDDPAIKALNAGVTLPATPIAPVHRSDKSGTTKNFTDYLSKAAPSAWTAKPDQVWPVSGGESGNGTSGLIAAVKGGTGTIGYADASQAGTLGKASVKVGATFNAPTAAGAAKAVDASTPVTGRPAGDLAITIDRTTTAAGAYPLVLLSYDIGCTKYSDAKQGALVNGLFSYITSSEGQAAAAKTAGSAPLSTALQTKAVASVAKINAG